MATESASKNGFTITHDLDNGGYTLSCQDSNFDTQTKTVTLKTEDKILDGNLVLTVKAKTGAASINSSTITPSFSQSGNVLTVTGSTTATASVTTAGWISSISSKSISISTSNNVNKYTIPKGSVTNSILTQTNVTCTKANESFTGSDPQIRVSANITPVVSTEGYISSSEAVAGTVELVATPPYETKFLHAYKGTGHQEYNASAGKLIGSVWVYDTSFSHWTFGFKLDTWYTNSNDDTVTLSSPQKIFVCLTDSCTIVYGQNSVSVSGGAIVYCQVTGTDNTSTRYYKWICKNYNGTATTIQEGQYYDSVSFTFKKNNAAQYYGIISVDTPIYQWR